MSPIVYALIILSASFSAYAEQGSYEQGRYLCHPDENVVFGCELGKKIASICASRDVTQTTGYVQYRFGTTYTKMSDVADQTTGYVHYRLDTTAKLELVYPSKLEPPKGHFFFSHTMFGGGDGSRIRFINDNHEYFVSSKVVRTNFNPGETNDPAESASIVTRFKGKFSTERECLDFNSINGPATGYMDTEDYDFNVP